MRTNWRPSIVITLALCGAWGVSGCRDADQGKHSKSPTTQAGKDAHDHAGGHEADEPEHPLPKDLAAGVVELKQHYQQIKEACEKNKADEAEEPLHAIGNLLESLPALARQTQLPDDDVKSLATAADKMFEAYFNIDEAIHDKKVPDYPSVAATLDDSMATIEAVAAKLAK